VLRTERLSVCDSPKTITLFFSVQAALAVALGEILPEHDQSPAKVDPEQQFNMFQHFILHSQQRQTAKEFATPEQQVDDLANGVPAAAAVAVDEAAGMFKVAQREILVEDVVNSKDDDPSPAAVTFLLFACVI
jgi:hypothetical protein